MIDDYSGVIVLREPLAPIWNLLSSSGAMIQSKKAGDLYENETAPLVFSGPYVVADWQPMARLRLARNPDWNGPVAPFDAFDVMPVDDDKSAEIAFDAGDLDVTEVAYSSAPRYMESPPPGAAITIKPIAGMEWVGMNVEHPKLADPRLRRAIQLAIDVPLVLEAAYFGVANEGVGIIAPGILGARVADVGQVVVVHGHPGHHVLEPAVGLEPTNAPAELSRQGMAVGRRRGGDERAQQRHLRGGEVAPNSRLTRAADAQL